MTGNLTLALLIGVLYTVGTYLLLQRTLTRVVIGLSLLGHGANLLLLQAGGARGQHVLRVVKDFQAAATAL